MDKYDVFDIVLFLSLLFALMCFFIGAILINFNIVFGMIIFIIGFIIMFFSFIVHHFYKNRYPNKEDSAEINDLIKLLNQEIVKNNIRHNFFNNGMNVYEISWKIEKGFGINIHYKKGWKVGQIKSKKLFNAVYKILGYNSEEDYIKGLHKYSKRRNLREYSLNSETDD